jgi:hypothetical protein
LIGLAGVLNREERGEITRMSLAHIAAGNIDRVPLAA